MNLAQIHLKLSAAQPALQKRIDAEPNAQKKSNLMLLKARLDEIEQKFSGLKALAKTLQQEDLFK